MRLFQLPLLLKHCPHQCVQLTWQLKDTLAANAQCG